MRLITPEEYIDDLYDGIDFPVDKNKLDLIGKLMTDYAKYYHRVQVKNCDLADVGGNEVALCRCGQPISVTECDDCLDNRIISDLES